MAHKRKIKYDEKGRPIKAGDPKWTKVTELRAIRNAALNIYRMPSTLKKINDFRMMYKRFEGNIPSHLKYTSDPVQMIISPIFEQLIADENPMIYEGHVRGVVRDGGAFVQFVMSQDTAYRPLRNWLLHQMYLPENVKAMQAALKQELETENYLDPKDYYDNMKVDSKRITREKQEKGLIPKDSISAEQSVFIDEMNMEKFKNKVKNKEV